MAGKPAKPSRDLSITPVRRRPALDFSVTGLVYISMMLFMGLAAINSQANLLFGVFGLMIGILLISGIISKRVLRKLMVKRILPEHAVVGQPMTLVYEFNNKKRFWPSLSVTVAEIDGVEAFYKQPHGYLLHAAPGTTAVVPVELVPKRRGVHRLDRHQISTSFPFGFIKRAIDRHQEDYILIFPALGEVDPKLLTMMRSAEHTGPTMRPRRGGMDEFYGLKEYRAGENPRHIYWRRSARTGTLVVKEMTLVAPPRLLLLVDTYLEEGDHASVTARADVEKCIAMAASIVNYAIEENLPIGLFARSTDGWAAIPANRGKRHRRDVLTVLAKLPSNTAFPTRQLLDASYELQESGTTALLLTPRDIQLGLGETVRSGMVVISPANAQTSRWFKFARSVDFTRCMPVEAGERGKGQGARRGSSNDQTTIGLPASPLAPRP